MSIAIKATQKEADELKLPIGFLPDTFTLTELQTLCEQLAGRELDKSSFRRKLKDRRMVEPVTGEFVRGRNRPALLYRLTNLDELDLED
jgi:8-oxo-dGTP diphosphatase